MKKKILMMIILFFGILTGCELNNNPTSKTEEFLSKYQMLDSDIIIDYTDLANDTNISTEIQETYKKLIRKQYQNLTYEIKEEIIDGDQATITTQIEVTDYKKIMDKYDKTAYSKDEYHRLITEDLEQATEKVTYTIDFEVKKDKNGNWNLQTLSQEDTLKLLGMK